MSRTRVTGLLGQLRRPPVARIRVAAPPQLLDRVMAELVAVSASATSKRAEAANLARIWGRGCDRVEPAATA